MEKGICTIETWEDFKREIKRQFYPEDVAYLARKNMRRLKHTGSIRDYQELRRRGVQDLATAMAVAESLTDYKRGDSSKVESLEDSHAMGGGDEVPMDHNAPKKGSSKMPNRKALSAMIEEREQEDEAHMGSMQLLGALQFNPKPSTPKTSLLSGVQVKEAKGERAEVTRTHMDEVTKGKVNSMGKRKQHSKHRKCIGLHPSEVSQEKEAGKLGTCGCLEKVMETHREVLERGNDEDVDDIGGGECHRMLQMTLSMGLYRRRKLLETLKPSTLWWKA
ncbi:hypothetical protein AAG906_001749 [Vitis piasezkii]